MRKLIVLLLLLGAVAPTISLADDHKCDCKAHDMSEECKKECAHGEHK